MTVLTDADLHLPPPWWCRYCGRHLQFVPSVGRWVSDDAYGELHCPYGIASNPYHDAEHQMGWDQT